jgi:hypothetical protein
MGTSHQPSRGSQRGLMPLTARLTGGGGRGAPCCLRRRGRPRRRLAPGPRPGGGGPRGPPYPAASHRLVLTSWQPRTPEDARLPSRLRIDWTTALRSVGFVDVQVESRAEWHELFTRVYRVALDLGSPGEDVAPTGLQDEARRHLPIAELVDRVVVTATRPDGGVAAGPAG